MPIPKPLLNSVHWIVEVIHECGDGSIDGHVTRLNNVQDAFRLAKERSRRQHVRLVTVYNFPDVTDENQTYRFINGKHVELLECEEMPNERKLEMRGGVPRVRRRR